MAKAYLGQTIVWKPSPQSDKSDCAAAIVTRVGHDGKTISCTLFPADTWRAQTKDAVKHQSDPDWIRFGNQESGVWCEAGTAPREEIDETVD